MTPEKPVINAEALRNGRLEQIIPELTPLKHAVEINEAHDHQTVFDHTVATVAALEELIAADTLETTFSASIGNSTRKEILFIAGVTHDIAKGKTLVQNPTTGITDCPRHEVMGSEMAKAIALRLGLDNDAAERVRVLVLRHQDIHGVLAQALQRPGDDRVFKKFQKNTGDLCVDLLLLGLADIQGGDRKRLGPEQFFLREHLLLSHLQQAI